MAIDGFVLALPELESLAILDVRHAAPGRFPLDVPLVVRHAALGRALLELDGIASGQDCSVDELASQFEGAVVVDSDFSNDKYALIVADKPIGDPNPCVAHDSLRWLKLHGPGVDVGGFTMRSIRRPRPV